MLRIPVDGGYMAGAGRPEAGASAGPRPRPGCVNSPAYGGYCKAGTPPAASPGVGPG